MLKFIFLSEEFYSNYKGCKEIEQKTDRPYIMVCVQIGGVLFAVPMRSHIKHKYALWTDKENHCGVDFSKAVVILKESYIEQGIVPHIRQAEFDSLRGKDMLIVQRMKQYNLLCGLLGIGRVEARPKFGRAYFEVIHILNEVFPVIVEPLSSCTIRPLMDGIDFFESHYPLPVVFLNGELHMIDADGQFVTHSCFLLNF